MIFWIYFFKAGYVVVGRREEELLWDGSVEMLLQSFSQIELNILIVF